MCTNLRPGVRRIPAVSPDGSVPRCRGRSVGFPGVSPSVVLVPGAPVLVPELSGSAVAETESGVAAICEMLRRAGRGAARVVVLGTDRAGRGLGDML